MKFAVIGASSFSGTAFLAHLDRQRIQAQGFSRPKYDLNRSLDALLERLEALQPEYVVNFAALNMVAESWAHFPDYYRTNVIGVANLAEGLRGQPWLKKFVQVSTPEVYGAQSQGTIAGGTYKGWATASECEFIEEGAPFRPSTPYAVSRAAIDMHLQALHNVYGFPVAFTRTVNVYGPGQQPYRIIPKTVFSIRRGERLQLHGGGVSTRSFIHIADVAEATLRVARDGRDGETYHIATARQTAIRDLVRMTCERMGADFEQVTQVDAERPGKDMAYQLDDSKIRAELGWQDMIGLEDGLAETVAWFAKAQMPQSLEYEHRP